MHTYGIISACHGRSCFVIIIASFLLITVQLSLEVLELHNRFECGGDWALERTFNAWVEKQSWRKLMPVQYFQFHVSKIKSA